VNLLLPLLPKLYADELPVVREREERGKARRTVLQRLDQLAKTLADAPEDVTAEEWLATGRTTHSAAAAAAASLATV
jgi:hypothetical protein